MASAIAEALRCHSLPRVDELVLDLPHPYNPVWPKTTQTDEALILHTRVAGIMHRLQHLRIRIGYDSGGERYWEWDDPPPVRAFFDFVRASKMVHLVQMAGDLRHLEISNVVGQQLLMTLDGMQLASSARLSSLCLRGVRVSSQTIASLVEQCWENLGRVRFDLVELESGTWEGILNYISRLPQLHYFYVDTCGYSPSGSSRHLRSRRGLSRLRLPPPESRVAFESKHDNDWPAYAHIQRRVSANRKAMGLEPMDGDRYLYLGDYPDYQGTETSE